MGLDPATDFYNKKHVNVRGAEKYTKFFADYLTKKYELVDHREDSVYEPWWELYKESYLLYTRPLKESARSMTQENREAIENETKLREIDDAPEWLGST